MQQLVAKSSPFDANNVFGKIKEYIFFEISAVRTGVCAYMDATQHGKKKQTNEQTNE